MGTPMAFLIVVLAMELTPGPNMAYLAVVSARSGRRVGLAAVMGVTLGLLIYLAASTAGLVEAASRWPAVFKGLKWAGVAYLLWLAWDAWRHAATIDGGPAATGLGQAFLRGLVANLLNPKAALLYVTLLPGFIRPGAGAVGQALWLGSIHIAVSLMVHCVLVFCAGGLKEALERERGRALLVSRTMAIGMALVALWLALAA